MCHKFLKHRYKETQVLGQILQVCLDAHIADAVCRLVEKCYFNVSNHSDVAIDEFDLLWNVCKREGG